MASVIPKRPVCLTAHQQNLLAGVCQILGEVRYAAENDGYDEAQDKLLDFLETWMFVESKSQDWGTLYDIMHRTGENA